MPYDTATAAEPTFSDTAVYAWPYTGGRMRGLCTGDPKCIGWCAPGIFDGGCTADCQGNDGGSLGATVTDPATAACVPSFIPGAKALDITAGSQAPFALSTSLDYPQKSGNPGTFFTVGLGRGDAGAVPPNRWNYWQADWTDPISAHAYFVLYYDPENAAGGGVGWWQAPITEGLTQASEQLVNFYGIANTSFEGPPWDGGAAKNCVAGINLVQEFVSDPGRLTIGTDTHHTWGSNIGGTQYLNGPWVGSGYYSAQLTATETRVVQDKLWGVYNAAGVVTPIVDFTAAPRGEAIDHSSDGGSVDMMWTLFPLTDETGALRSHRAYQNFWALDPVDATTWTAVNLGVANANVASGPFDTYRGGLSADDVIDLNAAAFAGARSPLGASDDAGLHWWSASCIMKKGRDDGGVGLTFDKARIAFTSTGGTIDGGTATCDFSGLTSTDWVRNECRASYFGGTAMKADILVGNAASDVGGILVDHCQLTRSNVMNPPVPWSTARPQYYHSVNTSNWPTFSSGGELEFVHRALFNPVEIGTSVPQDTYDYKLDTWLSSASEHCAAFIFGELSTSDLFVAIRDGAGGTSDLTPAIGGLVPGTLYATKLRWLPVGGGKCKNYVYHNTCVTASTWDGGTQSCTATSLVDSDTTGTAFCPCQPDRAYLGNRLSGDYGTETSFSALRLRALQ